MATSILRKRDVTGSPEISVENSRGILDEKHLSAPGAGDIPGSFLRSLALAIHQTHLNLYLCLEDNLVRATVRYCVSPGAQPGRKLLPKGSAGAGLP